MPKQTKNAPSEAEEAQEEEALEEGEITIDMTAAKTFEPLPTDRPYLVTVSDWKLGLSAAKKKKLHVVVAVSEPKEFEGRKITTDLNIEEEYNLGRLQTMLINGFGFPENKVKVSNFKLPTSEEMVGLQATLFVRTQTDATGQYPDKSVANRWKTAAAYKAPAEKGKV